jgi:hypothetical protein
VAVAAAPPEATCAWFEIATGPANRISAAKGPARSRTAERYGGVQCRRSPIEKQSVDGVLPTVLIAMSIKVTL